MKFTFIIILILFILGNVYVFHRISLFIPPSNINRILLISIASFLVLSLFITFILGNSLPVAVTSFFYTIGTSWLFIFLYLFILTLIKDLIRVLHLIPKDSFSSFSRDNLAGLSLAFVFIAMFMVCGYLKYRWKVKVDVPIEIEKRMDKRESLRIVAISDLHLGYTIGKSELVKWIELINAENPDIVLIAGDIVDNSTRPLKKAEIAQYFKDIKAPLGIYTCLGNHEYISGIKESSHFIEEAGIHLLKDSYALVDSSFYVIGRDDRSNENRKSLAELVAPLDKSKPIILLDHQPYNLEEAENNGIDLQLSGHTHRGQVWPISLITDKIYEKSHGFLKKGNANIYVSSGIGIWGGKFRIGTQSEYVVIDIKQK